ncbi:hypothetical protein A616_17540 [Brevibacillus brevis X23]|nr:hypothetical protein A616_17540 [Brevibacillus brevis X23]
MFKHLAVSVGEGGKRYKVIDLNDVYMIKKVNATDKRILHFHTTDGEYATITDADIMLDAIRASYDNDDFVLSEKGILVNSRYVEGFDSKDRIIYFGNGERTTASLSKKKSIENKLDELRRGT